MKNLILIGEGALLLKTLDLCHDLDVSVSAVISTTAQKVRRSAFSESPEWFVSRDPNSVLIALRDHADTSIALSVNNKAILTDEALGGDLVVYNAHNGLVQSYRGIAEVCVMAAICHGAETYGATVHRLRPQEEVDAGGVVLQRSFVVSRDSTFKGLMTASLNNYMALIEEFLGTLPRELPDERYLHGDAVFRYRDVKTLLLSADVESRQRAVDLGFYSSMLPKLNSQVRAFLDSDSMSY